MSASSQPVSSQPAVSLTVSPVSAPTVGTGGLSRRAVLRAGAVGALGVGVLTACADGGPSADERAAQALAPVARAARADADAAAALIASTPDRAAALQVVADQRRTHATLIEQEIGRLHPESYSATPSAPAANPAPPTTLDDLRSRLTAAALSTADLAVSGSGYRAGLLGSVSAATSTLVKVQLA